MRRSGSSGATAPTIYRSVVRGELSQRYVPVFEGMTLAAGDGQTIITGPVIDQAHLHGLLDRIGDLGLELISVSAASPLGKVCGDHGGIPFGSLT